MLTRLHGAQLAPAGRTAHAGWSSCPPVSWPAKSPTNCPRRRGRWTCESASSSAARRWEPQIASLRAGVDVLVATPGRLIDLMTRRAVFLDAVEIAVLDEADHMADLGFLPSVTEILDATPAARQSLLFSATLDRGVDRLVARYLHQPGGARGRRGDRVGADDGAPGLRPACRGQAGHRGRDRRPSRPHPVLRPHQARRRSARQAAVTQRRQRIRDPRQPQPEPAAARARRVHLRTGRGCSSPPTWPHAACTSPTSTSSCTTTRPTTTRTTCTARVALPARAPTARSCRWSTQRRRASLAQMHAAIAVRAQVTDVAPGHPAVRAVAESGELIDVPPVAVSSPTAQASPTRRLGAAGSRSPHSSSQRSGTHRSGSQHSGSQHPGPQHSGSQHSGSRRSGASDRRRSPRAS